MTTTTQLTYTDPTSVHIEKESGMNSRKLLAMAKRLGWRTRKIYGRRYICTQDYEIWLKERNP